MQGFAKSDIVDRNGTLGFAKLSPTYACFVSDIPDLRFGSGAGDAR